MLTDVPPSCFSIVDVKINGVTIRAVSKDPQLYSPFGGLIFHKLVYPDLCLDLTIHLCMATCCPGWYNSLHLFLKYETKDSTLRYLSPGVSVAGSTTCNMPRIAKNLALDRMAGAQRLWKRVLLLQFLATPMEPK